MKIKFLLLLLSIFAIDIASAQYYGSVQTTHKDEYGRTIGTSTTTNTTSYGGSITTTHKDNYGRTIGTSTTTTDSWGNTTTTHKDEYGRTIGTTKTSSW